MDHTDEREYRTLHTVSRDKDRYLPGSIIRLPVETARGLLKRNPPAIADLEAPAVVAAPAGDPAGASDLTNATAVQVIAAAKAAETIDALDAIERAELARDGGARATVMRAIETRTAELLAPESEGDSDADLDGEDGG